MPPFSQLLQSTAFQYLRHPAWTILAFIIIKWQPNPWGVIAAGAGGSVIGRYILPLYMPRVSGKLFRRRENNKLQRHTLRLNFAIWKT